MTFQQYLLQDLGNFHHRKIHEDPKANVWSTEDMQKCWNTAIDACIEKFWTLDPAGRLVPSLEELKEK